MSAIAAEGLTLVYDRPTGSGRRDFNRKRRNVEAQELRASRSDEPPGIRDVSLAVAPGEVVGVLGPNGAGKSTLLRVLATALRPDAGELRLLGRDAVPPTAALRRRIGFSGAGPVHLDALSGRANALFFARAAGLERAAAAAAVAALFDRLGLAGDAHRPAGEYSSGMRRKLLLIQALAHAPALLFLDEPTVGLDPPSAESLRDVLRERAAGGAAVVVATHDVAFAADFCHRVLFLHRGRPALAGEPAELIRRAAVGTRIDVRLHTPATTELALGIDGARVVHAEPRRILVHTSTGSAVLPALCAALLRADAAVESIRVHEPDLADVFRIATGIELDAERGAA